MTAAALVNLVAFSLQVGVVAAVAGLAARIIRLGAPGVRYTYWRVVLGGCLALTATATAAGRRRPCRHRDDVARVVDARDIGRRRHVDLPLA